LRIRNVVLSLTILCFAMAAYAGTTTFYNDGGIDGNDNAFFISGPNNPNPVGSIQDISNGFISAASGAPNTLMFGEWVLSGSTPTSVGYELGSTAFGTDLNTGGIGGLITQTTGTGGNTTLLETNGFGYGVWETTASISSLAMTSGNEYWLSLSNATDSGGTNSGAWDIPNTGLGGPATCNFRQSGTNFGNCGLGGESFTLTGTGGGTTPEPSSIMLFGSGILGLAGVLRRKLNR
jgi:hypothetical protein